MFNNRNNHSQMPNQEEKICTLKKKGTLFMHMPHVNVQDLSSERNPAVGKYWEKQFWAKEGGAGASYKSGSCPVEVTDTMKVCLGLTLYVWTPPPHTDTLSCCLVAAARINSVCGVSIHQKYLLKCLMRRMFWIIHLKWIKKKKNTQTLWLTIWKDKKQNTKRRIPL